MTSTSVRPYQIVRALRSISYANPLWDESAVIEALTLQHDLLGLPIPRFQTVGSLDELAEMITPQPPAPAHSRSIYDLAARVLGPDKTTVPTRLRTVRGIIRNTFQVNARQSIYESAGLMRRWRYGVKDVTEDVLRLIRVLELPAQNDNARTLIDVNMTIVSSAANGLAYYVARDEVFYLVPLPRMTFQNDVLHSEARMAVEWDNGDGYYYLHGIEFTEDQHWRLMNDEFSVERLISISHADKRAAALSYFKPAALMKALDATLIDTGQKGTRLYRARSASLMMRTEAYFMLMDDASTDRQFVEWVPPAVGRLGDAELCQAKAFGITLEEWLSIPPEMEG